MNPNAPVIPALSSGRAFLMELDAAGKQIEAGGSDAFTGRLALKRLTAAVPGEIAAIDAALALAKAPLVLKAYDPRWGSPS